MFIDFLAFAFLDLPPFAFAETFFDLASAFFFPVGFLFAFFDSEAVFLLAGFLDLDRDEPVFLSAIVKITSLSNEYIKLRKCLANKYFKAPTASISKLPTASISKQLTDRFKTTYLGVRLLAIIQRLQ